MDLASIRRLVIVAMFSDDVLFDKLVLKGGNAISLVYRYGARGSLDVDFSIDGDFDDAEDAGKRNFPVEGIYTYYWNKNRANDRKSRLF